MTSSTTAPARGRDLNELRLYEGLRVGSNRALRQLLEQHWEPMVRVARSYVPPDRADATVAQAWGTALRGLSMFTWRGTFRSWLFGVLIAAGRAAETAEATPPAAPARILVDSEGHEAPASLAQLPWSSWWGSGSGAAASSWEELQAWLDSRPRAEREVVLLVDVLGWGLEEARDALGWTDAVTAKLLETVHTDLAAKLAEEMGAEAKPDQVGGLLAQLPSDPAGPPHPAVHADFKKWRVERGLTLPKRVIAWVRLRRRSF